MTSVKEFDEFLAADFVHLADQQTVTSTGSFTDVFPRVDGRWLLWLAHSTEFPAC